MEKQSQNLIPGNVKFSKVFPKILQRRGVAKGFWKCKNCEKNRGIQVLRFRQHFEKHRGETFLPVKLALKIHYFMKNFIHILGL